MRSISERFARSLILIPMLVLSAAADTIDSQVCCILDNGFGLTSRISIPPFDSSMGQLQSVNYDVAFAGQLFFQSYSAGSDPVSISYSASAFPSLSLGDPLYLNFTSDISESGTMIVQNGVGLVNFSGSAQITNGPELIGPPSSQGVSVQFNTSGLGSPDSGQWWLSYDSATLDVLYNYTPNSPDPPPYSVDPPPFNPDPPPGAPDPPDPPDPPPPGVPEPRMLWPIAIALPLIFWKQRKFGARRPNGTGITLE